MGRLYFGVRLRSIAKKPKPKFAVLRAALVCFGMANHSNLKCITFRRTGWTTARKTSNGCVLIATAKSRLITVVSPRACL